MREGNLETSRHSRKNPDPEYSSSYICQNESPPNTRDNKGATKTRFVRISTEMSANFRLIMWQLGKFGSMLALVALRKWNITSITKHRTACDVGQRTKGRTKQNELNSTLEQLIQTDL